MIIPCVLKFMLSSLEYNEKPSNDTKKLKLIIIPIIIIFVLLVLVVFLWKCYQRYNLYSNNIAEDVVKFCHSPSLYLGGRLAQSVERSPCN